MKKVLIDATAIGQKKAGVGVYARELIRALVNSKEFRFFILARDDDPDFDYGEISDVTMLRISGIWLKYSPLRLIFEQTILPFFLWRHDIDLVHSLHYSFPLIHFRASRVVTIHDMTSFSMPELHMAFKKQHYRFYIRFARQKPDGIIFISNSARNDFVTRFGPPRGSVAVIHHGKSDDLQPCQDDATLKSVREKYDLPSQMILYVGTIEPRKNLVRLVEAFSCVAQDFPAVALVIAGMKGWMYDDLFHRVQDLGLASRILFPGFIAEEDKVSLLCAAKVFAYVSLYEGFGLPVLEALACGIPTVTSNTSAIPEVAGNAAILVDPTDVKQIAGALRTLLSDSDLRNQLAEAGLIQAARFTWERTAAETLRVYRNVLAMPLVDEAEITLAAQ